VSTTKAALLLATHAARIEACSVANNSH